VEANATAAKKGPFPFTLKKKSQLLSRHPKKGSRMSPLPGHKTNIRRIGTPQEKRGKKGGKAGNQNQEKTWEGVKTGVMGGAAGDGNNLTVLHARDRDGERSRRRKVNEKKSKDEGVKKRTMRKRNSRGTKEHSAGRRTSSE